LQLSGGQSNNTTMAPSKEQLEKFRKMDKFKMEQRKKKRLSDLEAIGTREERQEFVETLKGLFYEKADNAYHYFIYDQYNKPFLYTCKQLGLKISRYMCQCHTEKERSHRHYILWIPNPRNVKQPTAILSLKMSKVMTNFKIARSEGDKRCIYGKKIKSRAHLLNTVLYIMTANTRGRHGGKVVDCKHFGHFKKTVIPDRETLNIFRREEVDFELPEYAEERRTEWENYKKEKNFLDHEEEYQKSDDAELFEEIRD